MSSSIFIPLYQHTIFILEKEEYTVQDKYELYIIVKYIESVYDSNKHCEYIHKIIQLINCALS